MAQNYNMLSSQLSTITEIISLSELHGLITAYTCLHDSHAFDYIDWALVDSLGSQGDGQPESPDNGKPLSSINHFQTLCKQMTADTQTSLEAHSFDFEPLLPDSGASYKMIQELAAWCRGFSYAMIKTLSDMSAGNTPNYGQLGLSEMGTEAMQDIIEISQVSDDSDEDDVDALIIELQEYLRIAVQTIFEEISAFKQEHMANEHDSLH